MSAEQQQRYPLSWPTGWKRTRPHDRQRARFQKGRTEYRTGYDQKQYSVNVKSPLTIAQALSRLTLELRRLGVLEGDWLLSSNLRTRLDGLPYSNASEPDDRGVAVYFRIGAERKPSVLACDRWDRVADNIAAIAGHIDAIRTQDRYGVGTLEQAFAGYAALPANTAAQWWIVFGLPETATSEQVDEAYRRMAREQHPDAGGSHDGMARLNEARDNARKALR